MDDDGNPKRRKGQLILSWSGISEAEAKRSWAATGWCLE
jgi:hypothetical protein